MKEEKHCSFCEKPESKVYQLGKNYYRDVCICDKCVLSYFLMMELTIEDVEKVKFLE